MTGWKSSSRTRSGIPLLPRTGQQITGPRPRSRGARRSPGPRRQPGPVLDVCQTNEAAPYPPRAPAKASAQGQAEQRLMGPGTLGSCLRRSTVETFAKVPPVPGSTVPPTQRSRGTRHRGCRDEPAMTGRESSSRTRSGVPLLPRTGQRITGPPPRRPPRGARHSPGPRRHPGPVLDNCKKNDATPYPSRAPAQAGAQGQAEQRLMGPATLGSCLRRSTVETFAKVPPVPGSTVPSPATIAGCAAPWMPGTARQDGVVRCGPRARPVTPDLFRGPGLFAHNAAGSRGTPDAGTSPA